MKLIEDSSLERVSAEPADTGFPHSGRSGSAVNTAKRRLAASGFALLGESKATEAKG